MKVTQLHELVNTATKETLGTETVVNEDLSNIVDIGKEIINTDNVDNFVKKLVNHIGKVVFVNRAYKGGVPSVFMDSWEYGSILEKISADLPQATENETWDLENGKDYSPDVFYKPSVSAKFFNSLVTFEIPLSFTEKQVKESFSSKEQLNGFISMLQTSVENAITIKFDSLIMRTINNMIAETLANDLDPEKDGSLNYANGTLRAVNLLQGFNVNRAVADKVTVANAFSNADFIKYATYQIGLVSERMARMSTLFNVGGKERFTPKDYQRIVMLSDFLASSEIYLLADTQNADKAKLPQNIDTIPYWQGSGKTYAYDDVTRINVKTSSGKTVNVTGVIGCIFDKDALGVTNLDRRVTTNYNPKAEFYTNFYKFDAGFFNDLNENFVVFYIA
jgi:hypothetical protein